MITMVDASPVCRGGLSISHQERATAQYALFPLNFTIKIVFHFLIFSGVPSKSIVKNPRCTCWVPAGRCRLLAMNITQHELDIKFIR
jgi:hypothetical protein